MTRQHTPVPPREFIPIRRHSAAVLTALLSGFGGAAAYLIKSALVDRGVFDPDEWLIHAAGAVGLGACLAYGAYQRVRQHEAAERGDYATEVYGGGLGRWASSWWALVPTLFLAWVFGMIVMAWLLE